MDNSGKSNKIGISSLVMIAFFAAFTVLCGMIRIPFFPVSITLQTLAVYLSGCLLGPFRGALSQCLYIMLGLLGLPIFSQGGGLGYVLSPSFGYLAAFPLAAWITGYVIYNKEKLHWLYEMSGFLAGGILILLSGSIYLYINMNFIVHQKMSVLNVFFSGLILFLPGEIVKMFLAWFLYRQLHSRIRMVFIVLLFLGVSAIPELSAQSTDLNKVRQEIESLEKEIRSKASREQSLLEQLEDLDREIGLRNRLLQELESEKEDKERRIRYTQRDLNKTTEEFERLKVIIAQRLVSMYKRGQIADWEILLTSSSVNQALIWLKYQRRIIENDERNLKQFLEKKQRIETNKATLQKDLNAKESLIAEKQVEAEKSEAQKDRRSKMLTDVQKDRALLAQQLERKRQAYQQITARIQREEKLRKASQKATPSSNFASLRGKMIWPVVGEIVGKFGRHKDPEMKIWTDNLGVDIKARENENVKAVHRGVVKWVTWLPVMGHTVLVDHGDGYYTVYGRLNNVFVSFGDEISNGMVIGQVGDRESLNQTLLHFELWKGKEKFNPVNWLMKG